jgi:hypothetical protein
MRQAVAGRVGAAVGGLGLALGLLLAALPCVAQAPPPLPTQPPAPPAQTAPVPAPAPEPKDPNTGRVSLGLGVDFPTDYYFRGILQEDTGTIMQPYGEINFKLLESDGPLSALVLTPGLWNSWHWGPTGADGDKEGAAFWYEADLYLKLGATFFQDLTASVIYTAYVSPNDSFDTVQEIAVGLSFNDAKLLGPFALNPSALIAFELDGQADAGRGKGTYLQLGVAPGYTLFSGTSYPLALSLPLTVGLSLDDYYEFGTGSDDTFGYFNGALAASLPLAFIPPSLGAWTIKASVGFLVLGDNLKRINKNDDFEVIGNFGFSLTY